MEMNEQAGDPFVTPNVTAEQRDGVSDTAEVEDPREDVTERIDAIESLQDSHASNPANLEKAVETLEGFEAEKEVQATAEAKVEEGYEDLSIEDIRGIVKVTSEAVAVAEGNLEKARKAYQIASQLEAECSAKPSLVEMNRAQVRVTAAESRHKARAMKALGALGFGDPKRKPYPQLFA